METTKERSDTHVSENGHVTTGETTNEGTGLSTREEIAEAVLNLPSEEVQAENERLHRRIEELEAEKEVLEAEKEDLESDKEALQESLAEQRERREEVEKAASEYQAIAVGAAKALNLDGEEDVSVVEEIKSLQSDLDEMAELLAEAQSQDESQDEELGEEVHEIADALERRTGTCFIDDGAVDFEAVWSIIRRIDEMAEKLNKLDQIVNG